MAGSDGEWQQVRTRKRVTRREKMCQSNIQDSKIQEDFNKIQEKLINAVAELRCEEFWLVWKELLTGCLAVRPVENGESDGCPQDLGLDCVCYGLGSFLSCISSRYQLAMLLLLLETLRIPPGQCCVFDPVFSHAEREALQALGFTVLKENEEGKRPVSRPTLFYLIHCGKALYNNLLWSNWSPQALPLLTIVGNSFRSIQERMVQRELQRDYSFISDIMGACQETPLPCSPRFLDVFNDTALLRFPAQGLTGLPPDTWAQPPEPQYLLCEDLEIIPRDQGSGGQGKEAGRRK